MRLSKDKKWDKREGETIRGIPTKIAREIIHTFLLKLADGEIEKGKSYSPPLEVESDKEVMSIYHALRGLKTREYTDENLIVSIRKDKPFKRIWLTYIG